MFSWTSSSALVVDGDSQSILTAYSYATKLRGVMILWSCTGYHDSIDAGCVSQGYSLGEIYGSGLVVSAVANGTIRKEIGFPEGIADNIFAGWGMYREFYWLTICW